MIPDACAYPPQQLVHLLMHEHISQRLTEIIEMVVLTSAEDTAQIISRGFRLLVIITVHEDMVQCLSVQGI